MAGGRSNTPILFRYRNEIGVFRWVCASGENFWIAEHGIERGLLFPAGWDAGWFGEG